MQLLASSFMGNLCSLEGFQGGKVQEKKYQPAQPRKQLYSWPTMQVWSTWQFFQPHKSWLQRECHLRGEILNGSNKTCFFYLLGSTAIYLEVQGALIPLKVSAAFIGHQLFAQYCAKQFMYTTKKYFSHLQGIYYYFYFSDEETKIFKKL